MIPIITLAFALLLSGFTPELSHAAGDKKARKTSRVPAAKNDKNKRKSKERAATTRKDGRAPLIFDADRDRLADRFDQPEEAAQWYLQKRLPKGEKHLPVDRYFEAKEKVKRMKRYSTSKGKLMPSQAEVGDSGDDGQFPNGTGGGGAGDGSASTSGALGTWQPLGPGNVGGRTRALLIDPNNPDVMYAAAVAGGIWKTINAGAAWVPLNDFLANIAVTCMVMDPTNPNVIYAGTGEGFFNADGVRGAGVFKTTDAGALWTRLAATASDSNFFFVNDLVVSPANGQHVYAATRTGVWRSLDGGASWTQVLVSNVANGANGAMDLVMRTDQGADYIFAAVGSFAQAHIYRNTDAGGAGAWVDVYTEANMGRTSLAIAPSNQNVIYAMATDIGAGNYNNGLLAVFRSAASGDPGTWATQVRNNSANKQDTLLLSNPVNAAFVECGFAATNNFLNQGWYDNVLAVDPTDENKVWAGGIDVFRSDNGGVNWGVASYWWFQGNGTPPNNGDPQLAHADNHVLVFHPNYNGTTNQTMFAGDDGGIYKTDNAKAGNVGYVGGTTPSGGTITTASPICGNEFTPGGFFTVPSPVIWGPDNNGYAVTQFYHGLPYPNGQTYFGGTQDNGTNRGTDAAGPNAWARINGGDGGYVAVNPTNTNTIFFETTGLTLRRSTNGGASSSQVVTGIAGDAFPFITVFRMDPITPTRLWIGGRFMWRTDNNATNWTRTSNAQQTGGSITAIAVSPANSNVVIDGAASGQLRRTTVGLTANAASVLATTWLQSFTPRGNGNGTISWVEYDPTNPSNVWATISNFNGTPNAQGTSAGHVFKSTDGGATWTLADGTQTPGNQNAIPDIPAHSVVVDPNNSQRIYVGTDLGVFVSLDGGQNWARETTGFSNVVVESLSVLNNNGVTTLFAFTHGRGAFKVAIPASCSTVSPLSQAFFSPGNTGSVTVTKNLSATAACDWNAVSNDSFITIDSGASGSGNGTVNYTVAQNTTGAPRTGTLTVAGRTVTITQDAAPLAVNDSATTNEDTPVNINVLANDSDPDGDTLTVTAVTQGAHGAVTINPDKTVRYAPAQDYFGPDAFTYTVGDGHGGTSTANVNVTVNPVNDPPYFTSLAPADQTRQYSDPIANVTLVAADVDSASLSLTAATCTYTKDAGLPQSGLPAGLSLAAGGCSAAFVNGSSCSWTLSGVAGVAQGVYVIQLGVTDGAGGTAAVPFKLTVTKELALAVPQAANPASKQVGSAGGSASGTVTLCFDISEVADGSPGDLINANSATVAISAVGTGSASSINPSSVSLSSPVNGVRTACVTLTLTNTPVNVYEVTLNIGGNYYTGSGTTAFTVFDPSLGFVTGGGWITRTVKINGQDVQVKANYGVNIKYNKGGNAQGSLLYIEHRPDGDYRVKSNSLGAMAIVSNVLGNEGQPTGKATYQGVGNYTFVARVIDGDPKGLKDQFGFKLIDPTGVVVAGLTFDPIILGGGNNQVPQ
jgi:hypothetical protein